MYAISMYFHFPVIIDCFLHGDFVHCFDLLSESYETIYQSVINFSLAANFSGICLLSAFILLRRLKLASVSIFHS